MTEMKNRDIIVTYTGLGSNEDCTSVNFGWGVDEVWACAVVELVIGVDI